VSGVRCQTSGYWLLVTGSWPEAKSEKPAAKKLTPETIDIVLFKEPNGT